MDYESTSLDFSPPFLSFLFYSLLTGLSCCIFDGLQCVLGLLDGLARNRRPTTECLIHLQSREFLNLARSATQSILDLIASANTRRTNALPRHMAMRNRDRVFLRQRREMLLLERAGVF